MPSLALTPRGHLLFTITDDAVEPLLQSIAALAPRQEQNPESDLSKHDPVDGQLRFMAAQPCHDRVSRFGLRHLREDVGVDQKLHRVSVDSDSLASIATKNPFSGQRKSRSTRPRFLGGDRRTSR